MRSILSKIYHQTKSFLGTTVHNMTQAHKPCDLLIVDDFFPNPISAFRFSEYNHYFNVFAHTQAMTTGGALSLVNEKRSITSFINQYRQNFPRNTVNLYNISKKNQAKAAYAVFLNNAYQFLPYFEKQELPFVFTLYPGGGFKLNDAESDKKLEAVCKSPLLRGIIVTQAITYDYLLGKGFCSKSQIKYVFGGILPLERYPANLNRLYWGFGKTQLDVCFMANKYTEGGVDKGFDVFVEVAKHFSDNSMLRFHVVGAFTKADVLTYDAHNIQFHGNKLTDELNLFFENIDVMLSPNRAFVLDKGAFDGYPTGCCVEASFKGVAIFATDPLNLNRNHYAEGKEIETITPSVSEVVERLSFYLSNPKALRDLGINGEQCSRYLFSQDYQLMPRVQFLEEKLGLKSNLGNAPSATAREFSSEGGVFLKK